MTVQRIVGIGNHARDAAGGLRDARAVAGGVQGVGVAGEESAVVGVCQGGQAAGGVVGVRGDDGVGQRGRAQTTGGIVGVGGRAGGPVGDLDEAVVGVVGVMSDDRQPP